MGQLEERRRSQRPTLMYKVVPELILWPWPKSKYTCSLMMFVSEPYLGVILYSLLSEPTPNEIIRSHLLRRLTHYAHLRVS